MRILLVDTTQYYPTSPLFLEAVQQLAGEHGYDYEFFDEARFLKPGRWPLVHKIVYRLLGRRPLAYWAYNQSLLESARSFRPDVVFVVKGACVSRNTLRTIKLQTSATLINYATDDPFNRASNSRGLVESIPGYDIYTCTKTAVMEDVRKKGCKRVAFVPFGYKPSAHFPEQPSSQDEKVRFGSDVVFIGGCDADRVPYFEALVQRMPDLRLHLYGGYWGRHHKLRPYHRGFAMGRDYRLALGGARIVVNLVRRANRDGHVMRSFEVPACGAFMLAERTKEHLDLFKEAVEAAYFNSAEELVEKVRYYLSHETERQRIAEAGYRRVTTGGNAYTDRLTQVLALAGPTLAGSVAS